MRCLYKILLILTLFFVANKVVAVSVCDYYPYGNIHRGSSGYKYSGKYLDRTYGLDLYDFHARQYETQLPGFTSPDPLAEKYYDISPYAYCAGDPVNSIDPDGNSIWTKVLKATAKIAVKTSKSGVKALGKAATYADAFSGIVDDVNTLTSDDASTGDKVLAGLSLASEFLPVSIGDAKDVVKGVDKIGNVAEPLVKAENAGRTTRQATKGSKKSFFKNSSYTPKVKKQMSNSKDKQHAFPQSVDGYAEEYGIQSTKTGKDGIKHEWSEVDGSYNGKTGTFEYIKDADGNINHRFFKTK